LPEIKDDILLNSIKKSLDNVDIKYNSKNESSTSQNTLNNTSENILKNPLENSMGNPLRSTVQTSLKSSLPTESDVLAASYVNSKDAAPDIIASIISELTQGNKADSEAAKKILQNTDIVQKLQLFMDTQTESIIPKEKVLDLIALELPKSIFKLPKKSQLFMEFVLKKLTESGKNNIPTSDQAFIEDTKSHIEKVFSRALLDIESGDLSAPGSVKEAYKELFEKLNVIKQEVVNSSYPLKEQISDKIDSLQNNLRFINEVSNYAAYLQIPVTIKGSDKTAELYILKREGSKKRLDPDNMTVYLSLDTQNLGRVDSLVNVSRKSVMVNFKLTDKKHSEVFSSHYNELFNSLDEIGYKLVGMNFGIIKDEINLMNAQSTLKREIDSNKVSIDYKI
jgi:hypothetical protein